MKQLLAAALVSLVVLPAAQAGVINKVPYVITKPGKYTLKKDLTPSASASADFQAAIAVLSPNVELDLSGFSVIANPDNAGITKGIVATASDDLRIVNGRVSGFATGISIGGDCHDVALERLQVKSPTLGATLTSKGTLIRDCSFILTTITGSALKVTSSGGGPAHVIERCSFYATTQGVAVSQLGLDIGGGAPTVVRSCQFLNLGQGLSGNNSTTIADNLFQDCIATFDGSSAAGFNQ